MTDKEVFKEITSKPKWYAGYISPQSATNLKARFNDGKVRLDTLVGMFEHFGYKLEKEWQKKNF